MTLLRRSLALPQVGGDRWQRCAIMGDSIAAQNITAAASYMAGPVAVALARLGHPWYLAPAANFAIAGTTLAAIVATQLPAIVEANKATPFDRVFLSFGTNDTNADASPEGVAAFKLLALHLFESLQAAGIVPVWWGVLPRGNDGAMTDAKRANLHLCEWGKWLADTTGLLEFVDVGEAIANNATANGNALATMTDAGFLHPIDAGGWFLGRALADAYAGRFAPNARYATSQADAFHATYNPTGIIFDAPNPLLQGGAGTPTGMQTGGGVWTAGTVNLPNGQTRKTADCALAVNATHFLYQDAVAAGAWNGTRIKPGMRLYAAARVTLTGVTDLRQLNLRLVENDGTTVQTVTALAPGVTGRIDPDNVTLHLMTPPLTVRAYSGAGVASVFVRVDLGTGAAGAGQLRVHSFELRPWVGDLGA